MLSFWASGYQDTAANTEFSSMRTRRTILLRDTSANMSTLFQVKKASMHVPTHLVTSFAHTAMIATTSHVHVPIGWEEYRPRSSYWSCPLAALEA